MSAKTNAAPRTHWGTDAEKAAYTGPKQTGDKYITESGVYGWDGTTWRGGTSPGSGLSNKYWVNVAGQLPAVGYTTITSAVAAAVADGATTAAIMVYPGAYAESFSLPDGYSVVGLTTGRTQGTVVITGNIRLTGTTAGSTNSLSNIVVLGKVWAQSAVSQPINVTIDTCVISTTVANTIALDLSTTNMTLQVIDTDFEVGSGNACALSSDGTGITGTFTNCKFTGHGTELAVRVTSGSWIFSYCDMRSGNGAASCIQAAGTTPSLTLESCILRTSGGATYTQWILATPVGATVTITGTLALSGTANRLYSLDAAANITVNGSIHFGGYTVAALTTQMLQQVAAVNCSLVTAWATNGRKVAEGPGVGTGVPVYWNQPSAAWLTYQDVAVLA